MKTLTMLEFTEKDFETAAEIADRLGYEDNTAYTSTSDIIGLFCMPFNPEYAPRRPHVGGCVIKTKEFGFMFVQTDEDMHMEDITKEDR